MILTFLLASFVLSALALYLISRIWLAGPDLSQFDHPLPEIFPDHPDDEHANQQVATMLRSLRTEIRQIGKLGAGFQRARAFADNISNDLVTDSVFRAVNANGVACEWTIAANANPRRRILFLHGGAFLLGSPKGHRRMTDQLSKLAGAVVLSVDYRMLPEHGRRKGIEDVQTAYQWILRNSPDGPSELEFLLLAGDSAGGNLALMLASWSKTAAHPQADGVIAFSPSTDVTMSSPSIRANLGSDKILGEGLGLLMKIPKSLRLWFGLISARINPADPLSSPLFGDLSGLPKTLIHASSSEMLLGEAVRYTNKAKAAGSDVSLQIWQNQLHDWHFFNMHIGSGLSAWAEVKKFIDALQAKLPT